MQTASELVQGGMATLFLEPATKIGTILDTSLEWCRSTGIEDPVLSVANFLYPHCIVMGGSIEVSENNFFKVNLISSFMHE